jgi:hypothetical protein
LHVTHAYSSKSERLLVGHGHLHLLKFIIA